MGDVCICGHRESCGSGSHIWSIDTSPRLVKSHIEPLLALTRPPAHFPLLSLMCGVGLGVSQWQEVPLAFPITLDEVWNG